MFSPILWARCDDPTSSHSALCREARFDRGFWGFCFVRGWQPVGCLRDAVSRGAKVCGATRPENRHFSRRICWFSAALTRGHMGQSVGGATPQVRLPSQIRAGFPGLFARFERPNLWDASSRLSSLSDKLRLCAFSPFRRFAIASQTESRKREGAKARMVRPPRCDGPVRLSDLPKIVAAAIAAEGGSGLIVYKRIVSCKGGELSH